jgi:hypothetical protein
MVSSIYTPGAARELARVFNDVAGAEILRVDPDGGPYVIPVGALLELENAPGWYHARTVFEHAHRRAPSHGELVSTGRMLARRYPRKLVASNVALYFIAPAGTSVPSLA